jgi:deoxyribodipyrimidine photo-lyase
MTSPIIYWFRNDLRLDDLPGLASAMATGAAVIPCYVLDDHAAGPWRPGSASRWWLHHSLAALGQEIAALSGNLILRRGDSAEQLGRLVEQSGAQAVYCSRQYEPWAAQLERDVHQRLASDGVSLKRYPGSLLFEPENISNQSGLPFRVFTPFWRHCRAREPDPCISLSQGQSQWHPGTLPSEPLEDWALTPRDPDWASQWQQWWTPGGDGAVRKLETFLEHGLADYSEGRDHPALEATTRLSPHLHFGEISPRRLWHSVLWQTAGRPDLEKQAEKLLSELGWREFSYHLMHHFPHIAEEPFKVGFREFPWIEDNSRLHAWQRGRTGYPIVDAGMRELWATGYMHNRVRMITASFLTKHLLIHWREGADWFWDTLVDADLANNSCGWQWVAGSGADASPYFRIFNPVLQGKKFDAAGEYVRRWVPELAGLPDRYLNSPWEAPAQVLRAAGITLGSSYPLPIVDHSSARESALTAYRSIRKNNG